MKRPKSVGAAPATGREGLSNASGPPIVNARIQQDAKSHGSLLRCPGTDGPALGEQGHGELVINRIMDLEMPKTVAIASRRWHSQGPIWLEVESWHNAAPQGRPRRTEQRPCRSGEEMSPLLKASGKETTYGASRMLARSLNKGQQVQSNASGAAMLAVRAPCSSSMPATSPLALKPSASSC